MARHYSTRPVIYSDPSGHVAGVDDLVVVLVLASGAVLYTSVTYLNSPQGKKAIHDGAVAIKDGVVIAGKATSRVAKATVKAIICGGIWAGDKIIDGATWVGDKAYDGAVWVGDKAYDGAIWVGDKVDDGAKWLGEVVFGRRKESFKDVFKEVIDETKGAENTPIGRENRKKQSREVNEKKRKGGKFKSRSNKDPNRPMKKHTPGDEHRKFK